MGYFDSLRLVKNHHHAYSAQDSSAYWRVTCPDCGSGTMLAIAQGDLPATAKKELSGGSSAWLMCNVCGMGTFAMGYSSSPAKLYPRAKPLNLPNYLDEDVRKTALEALGCYTVDAFTACTLMCRKIIFHMAVDAGLPEKNERGFAPSFFDCVEHLVEEGYITKRQKEQWVDSVRVWGNTATHELDSLDGKVALSALEFTFQLLKMVYSFAGAAAEASSEDSSTTGGVRVPPRSGPGPL